MQHENLRLDLGFFSAGIPVPSQRPIRILIEATPNFLNMGDLAMLEVAWCRLRSIWPQSRITLFTDNPGRLPHCFPEAEWIPVTARRRWFQSFPVGTPPADALNSVANVDLDALDFANRLRCIDLYIIAGMGSFHDVGGLAAAEMLETIRIMSALNVPCLAFSQGIGPITRDSIVWSSAAHSLPQLELIALRECKTGPALTKELGVPESKIMITGDDAIVCAFHDHPATPPDFLGVNIRAASYSGITLEQASAIGQTIERVATRIGANPTPVPVSFIPGEADVDTFRRLFPRFSNESFAWLEPTTECIVSAVRQCRVVVTGAYHAAVFALSQGIPVVCIAASAYYRGKFDGLAAQFGPGCGVLQFAVSTFDRDLEESIEQTWNAAETYRDSLLAAAARQIKCSEDAWREIALRLPSLL